MNRSYRTRARHDEPILPTTHDKWAPGTTTHGSRNLPSKHAAREYVRATSDGPAAPRSVPRGRLVPVGPPGRRPGSPLPQPGLAIRAVGGRTSPAAGGLRNKPGGALPLCLSSCSWPLLLLRCHASCSRVQFSGSDSPSPPHPKIRI